MTSAGRRQFHFVAKEGAVQRIAELLNERVLKPGRPLSAQVVQLLRVQIGGPGHTRAGRKAFWWDGESIGLRLGSGVVEENLYAHLCQSLEFVEKCAVGSVIFSQENNGLVRTPNPTPISHGNHGQVAIEGLYDRLVHQKF
jgi:hypothetical protein